MSEINLTDDQKHALTMFTHFLGKKDAKYMIIQGAAGTGKSTLIEYLIQALEAQWKMYSLLLRKNMNKGEFEVQLTATTNKAARVLHELTNLPTQTIHSLLKLKVTPNVSTGTVKLTKKEDYCLLFNKLIIIDESSMINDDLFRILDNTTIDSKVVLIGDKYQLAPVRQKNPVTETLDCTTVVLNKVMRHGGSILKASALFRDVVETGVWCNIPETNSIKYVNGPTFQSLVDKAFTSKNYNSESAKILAWTNKKVLAYNAYVRKLKGFTLELEPGETVFTNKPIILGNYRWPTDAKIEITNVESTIISHGVPGRMVELHGRISGFLPNSYDVAKKKLNALAKEAKINPKVWKIFFDLKERWLDLRPAYSSTVHKAQGATYDTVFLDLTDIGRCNIETDVARMLYVGISRAAKQVYLYGELPPKYQEQL
jgi:hypothetical protein